MGLGPATLKINLMNSPTTIEYLQWGIEFVRTFGPTLFVLAFILTFPTPRI